MTPWGSRGDFQNASILPFVSPSFCFQSLSFVILRSSPFASPPSLAAYSLLVPSSFSIRLSQNPFFSTTVGLKLPGSHVITGCHKALTVPTMFAQFLEGLRQYALGATRKITSAAPRRQQRPIRFRHDGSPNSHLSHQRTWNDSSFSFYTLLASEWFATPSSPSEYLGRA